MVKVREDFTGKTFGVWKVLRQAEDYVTKKGTRIAQWECENINCPTIKNIFLSRELKFNYKTLTGRSNLKYKQNNNPKWELLEDYGIGYTTNTNHYFLFDLEDFDKIKKYNWSETNGHVISGCNGDFGQRTVFLHQLILDFKYKNTDHINKNAFDNRKNNLRECFHAENMKNKKLNKNNEIGITGIRSTYNNKWKVDIGYDNTLVYLGIFDNILDAIMVRLYSELFLYKEFAPQLELINKYNIKIETCPDFIRNIIESKIKNF